MEFLWRILNLWRKELLVILKDPANRIVLVAPVLMQSVLFGYAVTFDLNDAPYAVLDLSHSESSTRLISRLDGSGIFHRVAAMKGGAGLPNVRYGLRRPPNGRRDPRVCRLRTRAGPC